MGLFGSNRNNEPTALTIPGVGGGICLLYTSDAADE